MGAGSALLVAGVVLASVPGFAQTVPAGQKWVASWAASGHGPYPSGNGAAQPVLDFALPTPATGANDQTFRLIIKPDRFGPRARLRFANTFGKQAVTFDDVFVGLESSGGAVIPGTNRRVTFEGGKTRFTIPAGQSTYSDAVDLPFAAAGADSATRLGGRRLAVSFHAVGATGPMTWHAKSLTTSYLSAPGAGSHGADDDDHAFPFTTTSWFFLDAVDVMAPADTVVIACFGDSITDGTASTLNGDDRWPDVFSRRLHAAYGSRVSVVNAGIGGNQILGPAQYDPNAPVSGGPSARERLDRDVLALSGLSAVVLLEGINDVTAGATADAIIGGLTELAARVHAHGLKIFVATITSGVGSTSAGGSPDGDARRKAVNTFIRAGRVFDGVTDFDAVTVDPATGGLKPAFQPNSTIGGAGDKLHPNRAGYQAMGMAIDLAPFAPPDVRGAR